MLTGRWHSRTKYGWKLCNRNTHPIRVIKSPIIKQLIPRIAHNSATDISCLNLTTARSRLRSWNIPYCHEWIWVTTCHFRQSSLWPISDSVLGLQQFRVWYWCWSIYWSDYCEKHSSVSSYHINEINKDTRHRKKRFFCCTEYIKQIWRTWAMLTQYYNIENLRHS